MQEDFFDHGDQFVGLPSLLVLLRFLTTVDVHILLLVPSEKHDRDVERTAVAHLQRLHDRVFRIVVFFDRQDTSGFALQLRTDMPAQLDPVGHEVEHADDARIIDAGQPIEFVHNGNAFRLVVGGSDQIGDAIDDHEVDAAVPVMKQIHAFTNQFQTVFAREGGQIERMVKVRHGRERGTPQRLAQVLMELRLGLLRVVMQDGQPLRIGRDLQAQRSFGGQHGFAQGAGQDGGDVVALPRSLATRDAEQVILRPERHAVYGHHRLGRIGRIVIIDLARAQHHHGLAIHIGELYEFH